MSENTDFNTQSRQSLLEYDTRHHITKLVTTQLTNTNFTTSYHWIFTLVSMTTKFLLFFFQPNISSVLLRFRKLSSMFADDVMETNPQIKVIKPQRILSQDSPDTKISHLP